MPELPEVEITAQALAQRFDGRCIDEIRIHDHRLRWPVPDCLPALVRGQAIARIDRRGKYLLWHLSSGTLISHLGMSGAWRIHEGGRPPPRLAHDHVELFADGAVARFNDPRRFGALLWHEAAAAPLHAHPLLAGLGLEPFDRRFDGNWLWRATRGRRTAIKQVLLSGKAVVGVGNIYASESLYHARIHPASAAGQLAAQRCDRLARATVAVLRQAIAVGGSTLRDFSDVHGASGRYSEFALAYGRDGQACGRCGSAIRRIVQGQRATFYCPRCQRL